MTDTRSPFMWHQHRRPSIFAGDPAFAPRNKAGQSLSQIAADSVQMVTKRDGRNPGSVRGISAAGNLRIEESEHKRRRAR